MTCCQACVKNGTSLFTVHHTFSCCRSSTRLAALSGLVAQMERAYCFEDCMYRYKSRIRFDPQPQPNHGRCYTCVRSPKPNERLYRLTGQTVVNVEANAHLPARNPVPLKTIMALFIWS